MRVVLNKAPLSRILTWAQRALFASAALLLGYCGFVVLDTWVFQQREGDDLARLLAGRHTASEGVAESEESAVLPPDVPAVAEDGLIGRLEVPRLHFSAIVIEGVGGKALRRAVGHVPGTALPGEPGNVALSGHRDTFFRPLKDLKVTDQIRFSTAKGDFTYEVESLRVVEPDNVGVLAQPGGNALTLVTCYPFYYVGPAPRRWIARARQVAK